MKHQTSIIILLLSTIISLNCFAEVKYKEAKGRNYVRAYSTTDNVETVIAEIEEQLDMNAQDCRVKVYPRDWKKKLTNKKRIRPDKQKHLHRYKSNSKYYSVIKSTDIYSFHNTEFTVTVKMKIIE